MASRLSQHTLRHKIMFYVTLDKDLYKARLWYEHTQNRSKNKYSVHEIKHMFSDHKKKLFKPPPHKNQYNKFPNNTNFDSKNFQNIKAASKRLFQSNIPTQIKNKQTPFTRNKASTLLS